jgi:hypothetical protein
LLSLLAAAKRCVARRVAAECLPGMRSQLPFVPGFFPSTGSKPGQQGPFLFVPCTFFFAFAWLPEVVFSFVLCAIGISV